MIDEIEKKEIDKLEKELNKRDLNTIYLFVKIYRKERDIKCLIYDIDKRLIREICFFHYKMLFLKEYFIQRLRDSDLFEKEEMCLFNNYKKDKLIKNDNFIDEYVSLFLVKFEEKIKEKNKKIICESLEKFDLNKEINIDDCFGIKNICSYKFYWEGKFFITREQMYDSIANNISLEYFIKKIDKYRINQSNKSNKNICSILKNILKLR